MIDEMWMIRPHLRAFICGTRARVSSMTDVRLISRTESQSWSRISSIGWGTLVPGVVAGVAQAARRGWGVRGRGGAAPGGGMVGEEIAPAAAGAGGDAIRSRFHPPPGRLEVGAVGPGLRRAGAIARPNPL